MTALRTLRERAIEFEAAHVPVVWATPVLEGLAKAAAPTMEEHHDKRMALLRRLSVSEI